MLCTDCAALLRGRRRCPDCLRRANRIRPLGALRHYLCTAISVLIHHHVERCPECGGAHDYEVVARSHITLRALITNGVPTVVMLAGGAWLGCEPPGRISLPGPALIALGAVGIWLQNYLYPAEKSLEGRLRCPQTGRAFEAHVRFQVGTWFRDHHYTFVESGVA